MHVSEARLAANRLNAQKSTGPKTEEGKAISRRNGLKHGLAASDLVMDRSDAEEIARRARVLEADLAPRSPLGQMMVQAMATLSVRAERAAERETAAVAAKVRAAFEDFEEERLEKVEELYEGLADDPRKSLRRLARMPEGIDRLVIAWGELGEDLMLEVPGAWTAWHGERITLLTGQLPGRVIGSRVEAYSRAVNGDFAALDPSEGAGLNDLDRRDWARGQLLDRVTAEIQSLAAQRDAIDHERLELDRLEAPTRALFDPSKGAALARRYESEARRGFFKALKEFRDAEAEFAARPEAAPAPFPASPMGSLRDRPEPPPRDPARPAFEAPSLAPDVPRGADGTPRAIRPRPDLTP